MPPKSRVSKEEQMQILRDRKTAYCQIFSTGDIAVTAVMRDLQQFCRAKTSTFHIDQRAHALLEGRREVWLRIDDYLTLTVDELYAKYAEGEKDNGS